MTIAWDIAKRNFTDYDGSLPGIEFTCLTPDGVRCLVDYFLRHGTIVTENATLYDKYRQADVPLNQLDDLAGLVLAGTTDSFHCCFGGISYDDVKLPVLGVFVFRDCVEIDYRMGPEWNPDNVDTFSRLLAYLKCLAPEAIVGSPQNEGVPYPTEFKLAFNRYTDMQRA